MCLLLNKTENWNWKLNLVVLNVRARSRSCPVPLVGGTESLVHVNKTYINLTQPSFGSKQINKIEIVSPAVGRIRNQKADTLLTF